MRLLFICSRNRLRSPTAEQIFAGKGGVETASAGTASDAVQPLSAELIDWADVIFVMEAHHRAKLNQAWGPLLRDKKIVCLAIPDRFQFMEPKLIRILWERVPRSVPALAAETPDDVPDDSDEWKPRRRYSLDD